MLAAGEALDGSAVLAAAVADDSRETPGPGPAPFVALVIVAHGNMVWTSPAWFLMVTRDR